MRDYVARLPIEQVERYANDESGLTEPTYAQAARERLESERGATPERVLVRADEVEDAAPVGRVRVRADEISPVVYHGTPRGGFEQFDMNAARDAGRESGHPSAALGHWFSESKDVANDFAMPREYASTENAPAVYLSRLEMTNPARYENHAHLNAEIKRVGGAEKLRAQLESQGYDGVIVEKSTTDGRTARRDYVAFHPEQIKSAFEFKPEIEAQLTEHGLPVEEVRRSQGVDRSDAPEWVKKSDKYLKDLASGKIQNAIGVEGFIHVARVTAWDVYKATQDRAAWACEMTLRLGARVRPHLDDLWHFITSGQFTAETVLQRLKSARLVPTQMVHDILNRTRPEYVNDLVDFIAEQRTKVTEGGMTRSDVARAYAITAASQGADAIKADTFARKLQESNVKLDVPDEYYSHNRKGERTIRPEEAMAVWLQGETGQRALADLEAGKYNEAAWREGAKIRAVFGDDRLTKLNVLGKAQPGYFNMRNLHELTDALNAAKGDSRKIGALVSRANGIASGKTGFIKHLLGFGDTPTIDAQEINFWLTGRGDIDRREGRQVELARAVKDFTGSPRVSKAIAERITNRFNELQKSGLVGSDLPPESLQHITHQIIWDKVKGTESPHKAVYAAMRQEPQFVAESRARLKESLTGERLSAGPAQAMVDEATVLGWQTYQRTKEFSAWSSHMASALGGKSKPLFRGIFDWIKGFKPSSNPNRTGVIESASSAIKSGLLTSARVLINNLVSNATFQVMEEIARNPAAVADMMIGQGRRLVGLPARRTITASNLTAILHAAREGATRVVREALETIQQGATVEEMEKFLSSQEVNTGLPPLDALINMPFRLQGAQDKLTRVYAFHRALEGIAEVTAINTRTARGDRKAKVVEMVKEAYEGVTLRARAMNLQAASEAEIAVFANANLASDVFAGVKGALKKHGAAGEVVQFGVDRVVPFPRSGTNAWLRSLDYTGIPILGRAPAVAYRTIKTAVDGGLLADLKELDIKRAAQTLVEGVSREDQRKVAEMIGRGLTGQAIMLLGAKLGIAGLLSGFLGSSPADRGLDEVEGKRPGALRVGKTWVDIGGTGVLGNLLVLGASIADIASNPEYDKYGKKKEWTGRAINTATQFALDQPLGRPAKDLFEGYSSADRRLQKMAGSIASQVIPGWMADVAAVTDDRERDTKGQGKDFVGSTADGMKNSIMQRIPGLRQQLPEQTDALGQPIKRGIFTTTSRAGDPVIDELRRLDVGIGRGRYGKQVQERLESVIGSESYCRDPGEKSKFSPDDIQAAALKEAINAARDDEMAARKVRKSDASALVFNAKVGLERDALLEELKDSEFWQMEPAERKRFEMSIKREFAAARASLNPSKSVADEIADGREKLAELRTSR